MANLSITIGDIRFKNPIVAAAGEPTTDFEHMKMIIEAGAGAVVAKSISFSPDLSRSYDHARWAVIDENGESCSKGKIPKTFYFYGRGGIPLEPEGWMDTLQEVQKVADKHDCVLIGSIAAGPIDKMVDAAVRMEKAGIRLIEIDAGCPQAGQLKVDSSKELVTSSEWAGIIAKSVVDAVSIPVIYKVAAEDPDIKGTCKAVKKSGITAVTLINRFSGFLVDIEKGAPHINSWAGVGGPWMLPLSLKWVSRIHEDDPNYPIFGSNGATDWKGAMQFLMSGASLVSMCTIFMLKGYGIIPQILEEMNTFLDRKGYKSVTDVIGIAVRNAQTYEELYSEQKTAKIDYSTCIKCGKCEEACFYDAMKMIDGSPEVNNLCKGCGHCITMCPTKAIELV